LKRVYQESRCFCDQHGACKRGFIAKGVDAGTGIKIVFADGTKTHSQEKGEEQKGVNVVRGVKEKYRRMTI